MVGGGGTRRHREERRRRMVRLGSTVAAAVVVAACGVDQVQVGPPASAGQTPPRDGASGQAAPEVGECRGPIDIQIIDAAADTRPTTDCADAHGTETFFVGTMDETIDAWPGSDAAAAEVLGRQVDQECSGRHLDYLGFDASALPNLPPDRLQVFAFYIPTEADFADGARWFRCDALVEPLAAGEATTIEGSLAGVYDQPIPTGYRLCEARLGQTVSCDEEHEIEYLASVVLDDVTDYPSQRGDLQVTAACRTPLLDALGLSAERPDLVFGYLLPSQEAWDAGTRGATCVVGAADGSELMGSLAGIGASTPLPEPD